MSNTDTIAQPKNSEFQGLGTQEIGVKGYRVPSLRILSLWFFPKTRNHLLGLKSLDSDQPIAVGELCSGELASEKSALYLGRVGLHRTAGDLDRAASIITRRSACAVCRSSLAREASNPFTDAELD
jgi:hypothetical protein